MYHLIKNSKELILFFPESFNIYYLEANNSSLVPSSEMANILKKEKNYQYSKEKLCKQVKKPAPLALNVNLTPYCNLQCTYCFAKGGNYGTIQSAMDSKNIFKIIDLVNKYLDNQMLENSSNKKRIRFEYFGGEPLLNFRLIKELNDKSDQIFKEVEITKRISTNLTYITEEMLEFFKKNNFIFSISIDGAKETHDQQRPFKNGPGSFDIIINNIKKIQAVNPQLTFVARITYTDGKSDLQNDIETLLATGLFDYVSIYPSINSWPKLKAADKEKVLLNIEKVTNNYRHLFCTYPRFKGILEFEEILAQIFNKKISLHHCRAGTGYYTISPDNYISPCHRFSGDHLFNLEEIIELPEWQTCVLEVNKCADCWARYLCGGGCRQENFILTNNINDPSENVCQYQQLLIEQLIKNIGQFSNKEYKNKLEMLDKLFTNCGRQVA